MKTNRFRVTRFAAAMLAAISVTSAVTPGRAAPHQMVQGHVPQEAARLPSTGRLAGTQQMSLAIGLPLRNQDTLNELLREITDPSSPNYRHYLTPAQFTEQFGPTASDYETVAAFAEAHGLRVTYRHPNRLILDVKAAVSDIEKTLHVTMLTHKHPTEARDFYAPNTQPWLDLAVPIADINGLSDYSLPHPCMVPATAVHGAADDGSAPGGNFAGADFRNAYAAGTTLTGTGQSVGLLEFDSYYDADIQTYAAEFKIPIVARVNAPVDGGVAKPGSENGEVALDIEMVNAMAPGLKSIYVYEAPRGDWVDVLNQMATDDVSKQLSASWSGLTSEPNPTAEAVFMELAAQGQSFFNSSGDAGAYSGVEPFPSDSPNITVVGGTNLNTGMNGVYASESVWNGSSGGISTIYPIPAWQKFVSMANNQGSTTMRNTPDVAMVANGVWVVQNNGEEQSVGGTSCSSPLWAAFTALVNEQCAQDNQPPVGFLNPAFYAIGGATTYPKYNSSFRDVTLGNNFNTNSPTLFSAAPGYDLCTGWGSPNGVTMINALASPTTIVWVDFSAGGTGNGTFESPYNTLHAATVAASSGATILIMGGGNSAETETISKPLTIYSSNTPATVGNTVVSEAKANVRTTQP